MQMRRFSLTFLAATALLLAAGSLAWGQAPAKRLKSGKDSGFVASLSDSSLTLTNIPLPPAPPEGGFVAGVPAGEKAGDAKPSAQPQMRVLNETEAKEMQKKATSEGTPQPMVLQSAPPAGKSGDASKEEVKQWHFEMAPVSGKDRPKMAIAGDGEVKFTEFQLTAKTRRAARLEVGTRVVVHYRIEGDKKIATRIEPAK